MVTIIKTKITITYVTILGLQAWMEQRIWEDNIKMDFKVMLCDNVGWIHLTHDEV
jgi:hypothetical protein